MSADLKARIPHAWPVFFAPHGNFTEVQRRAIPVVLGGRDVLMVAATATGKTEAAVAPLLERHLLSRRRAGAGVELSLLYLCPTRALVRDLGERLRVPLAQLGVSLAMKSGDTGPVSSRTAPRVLVTTPESLDALLTRAPRIFTTLRALVLDEIHLFDDGPRGDQLRCLLRRVDRIHSYHREREGSVPSRHLAAQPVQRIALSATVSTPHRLAARYLRDPVIIEVPGGREVEVELYPLRSLHDLVTALGERAAAKTLIFCNVRNEVEQVASYLRHNLTFEAEIFVHYSNLDGVLRREVETRFAAASVAICVSSSTLELGIDIGTVDEVALIGPPSTPSSFWQRVGRGGRRASTTRVLCLPRSPREHLRFEALLNMTHRAALGPPDLSPSYHFRPSVLVQQVFSLLKQSPTGGIRFADLRRVAPSEVEDQTLRRLFDHLTASHYLRAWRPGEWQPGELLGVLADSHEIYSNIGGEPLGATVVDAYSGRRIARAEHPRRKGEMLLMGGRPVEVAWRDRHSFGVNRGKHRVGEVLRFRTAPQAVPLELAQGVAAQLELAAGEIPLLAEGSGLWLFHFWGDIYGKLLAALLSAQVEGVPTEADPDGAAADTEEQRISVWNELCLLLPFSLDTLPPWDTHLAHSVARTIRAQLEPHLELGRFQPLLPPDVALRSALDQIDLTRFGVLYNSATLVHASAGSRDTLRALL